MIKLKIYKVCDMCQGTKLVYFGTPQFGTSQFDCSKCIRGNVVTGTLETNMFVELEPGKIIDIIKENVAQNGVLREVIKEI